MPRGLAKGSDYALLQMKFARENKLKEATAHRTRARVVEDYTRASHRNNLEVERQNLNSFAQRMPPQVQQYYFDRIADLTSQIDTSKRGSPSIAVIMTSTDTDENINLIKNSDE